ncbi:molybdopterin-dependent oxidoreductase [Microbulbifer hydrolyticus]|uniref:Anaerobic selenocysteine-containing dehydrogenase/NAD-dependent dihydropyrimidine dehydrogenase PreA subunit n=2 Tax=Microbulbifer hydrolyticus TaxID=48074 RepID=A0AA89PFW4_9GAMM|nr:molybdopterin-dependent oxidoreductase [Microbulbifer hydrolyticus]MBB5213178.1 anaerobic selenocysteine-containing dehydrogenase/NAD-dependent dihydropyrimidine dehydrogenase PreA subunit [Microbulbifer hydrolyticus]
MAYVVTEACINHKHTNCVDVCPVEAFRQGDDMLYIDPEACIDCNACLTECPERAIFPESAVPAGQQQYITMNAEMARELPAIRESVHQQAAASEHAAAGGHFAVVGAGPSGFYTAEAILKSMPTATVDIFEKLPTPFGLVRYGVAPDHPRIKSVSASFERIAESPQVRFFGNVKIGQDLSTKELKSLYHAVVYATGGSKSRALTIPGADLGNIFGSSEFVGWYNGHPDHQALSPDLSAHRAAIIGVGNVALDIARILTLPHADLAKTDIADQSLMALRDSGIKEVCLLARRGVAQAAFTPKELEQLVGIESLDIVVDPSDLDLDAESEADLSKPEFSEARQNIALLRDIAQRPLSKNPATRRIRLMFLSSPESIEESAGSKQLRFVRTRLERNGRRINAIPTGEQHTLDVGLIINATGYRGEPVEGLPFDERRGVISNNSARVNPEDGNEYVAGWIKRGASGVIGSNKHCATETVTQLTSTLPETLDPIEQDVAAILSERNVEYINYSDWRLLDKHEQNNGHKDGRPRRKETSVRNMLRIIRNAREAAETEAAAEEKLPVKTHYRSCTLCEAMCGIEIQYRGSKIIAISGDDKDQHSWGHICPKGYSLQDLHNDPDRLKKPLRKVDGQWLEVSWDEALDYAAEGLARVQKNYGDDAVAGYWGNPTSHNLGLLMASNKLRKALNTRNIFTAASLDQMPHQLCSHLMFGHAQAFTIPDIDHTDYMLMLGANPAASNGSLMSGGDILKRLEGIHKRGGKLVLIDPRRNETAMYAQEHHFIRPTTDAFFLIGLIQHVISNELYKPGRLQGMMDHWGELLDTFNLFPMSEISQITGIPESEIERIAEEYAAADKAICYGRMGISAQAFGALNHYLINVLNIITGNLDSRGGMMFTKPAVDSGVKPSQAGSFATYHSRVRGLPEFNRELPATTMAEEMTTPGEGQVRGFICIAGNPGLSTPNGRLMEQGLSGLDFMVSLDFYLNETSRHADIILPPTGPLEHEQYDLVFNLLSVHNVAKFSEPLFPHEEGTRSDWDIMNGLIRRITRIKTGETSKQPLPLTTVLDYALRSGPYAESFDEYNGQEVTHHDEGLTLEKLKEYPHGLNLGPLQPCLPEFLFTEDRKIHMMPAPFISDLERLKEYAASLHEKPELKLIGRRDLRTNNSWMHNSKRLVKGKDRCGLYIHPMDAEALKLENGSKAKVRSRVGQLNVVVEITDSIMPGSVCLPHGWGHDLDGVQLRVAKTNPGINKNDLTDDHLVDEVSGNAALNGVPVVVEAL